MRTLALIMLFLLALPASASAHALVRIEGSTLKYVATDTSDATAVNTVTVSQPSPDKIVITDPTVFGGMDPGPCVPLSENRVECPSAGITLVRVEAGLGDDTLRIDAPYRTELIGGDGADSITGGPSPDFVVGGLGRDTIDSRGGDDDLRVRDGEADSVACGDGGDSALADSLDSLGGCEKAERGAPPAGGDSGAPELRASGLSVQRPLRRRRLELVAVCSQTARVSASATITAPGLRRRISLRGVEKRIDVAGGGVELRLPLPRAAHRALRTALRRGPGLARVLVAATDDDGNRVVRRLRIVLER